MIKHFFCRFSFKICSLSPTLRRWKIVIFSENYKCIGEILRRVVNSKQGNLRYRLNLVFHPSMTRSAEAKEFTQSVLTQWKDDIAGSYIWSCSVLFIASYYRQFSADIKMINILTPKPLLEFCLFFIFNVCLFFRLGVACLGRRNIFIGT